VLTIVYFHIALWYKGIPQGGSVEMGRKLLRDDQWERIRDILPGKAGDPGVTAKDNRLFVEAVLWIARTGAPWRDLPKEYGKWHNTFTRFSRWVKKGVWQRVIESVTAAPDLEALLIDSTIVRVHQHGAGALKKTERKPSGVPGAD
jgi:transposase